MDDLARARTLGEIVARLEPNGGVGVEGIARTGKSRHDPRAVGDSHSGVRRLLLEPCVADLSTETAGLAAGGLVLVTDDGRGIAREVAADLRALGYRVVRVRHGVSEGDVEGVNLASEAAVGALLDRVREQGELAGIVHLLPLRAQGGTGLDPAAWSARLGPGGSRAVSPGPGGGRRPGPGGNARRGVS